MILHFWFTLLDLEFLTTRHDNVAKILQIAIDTIGYFKLSNSLQTAIDTTGYLHSQTQKKVKVLKIRKNILSLNLRHQRYW